MGRLWSFRHSTWIRYSLHHFMVCALVFVLTGCPDHDDHTQVLSTPTLSTLTLSSGALNPSFDPSITNYSTMFLGATSVAFTPSAASGATITINGTPVPNGVASGPIILPSGNSTITILVTGPDGGTTTYTITAHRLAQETYAKASNTGTHGQFGYSVAMDGNTLVVAANLESSIATGINGNQADTSAFGAGAVYVFTRSGTTWTQQAYIKASNTDAGDHFGDSVALSGDTLAVGAPNEDSNGTGANSATEADDSINDSGAVYIFTRSGTTWTQQAYIKASNTDADDLFGSSVALDGDTLAVGALQEDSNGTGVNSGTQADNSKIDSGAVYVFTRSGTTWSQQAYVKASNTDAGDFFGRSVALSGDTLGVGANGEGSTGTGVNSGAEADNTALNSGAVYVFTRSGATWSQQAYVKALNTGASDRFGYSIALSGDTLAVGAFGEDSNGTGVNSGADADNTVPNSGAVYVFTRSGTTWRQQAYVKASNTEADDAFSYSLALSGNTLVVGANTEDSNGTGVNSGAESDNGVTGAGAVYVFQ